MGSSNLTPKDIDDLQQFGFTVIRSLDQGTFSKVYQMTYSPNRSISTTSTGKFNVHFFAAMKRSHDKLACKVIKKSYKMPKNYLCRFVQREMNILTKLHHPYIPLLHSILRKGPKFMIFMTCALRGNLCNFIIENGPIREKNAIKWFRQLIIAMIYLHTMDIAHRDISCDNILITENYNVKLCDFGYACFNKTLHGWPKYFHTHCGSTPYVAPEIIQGVPYNPKYSDIWSLGIVLFVMFNGTFPFTTNSYEKQYSDQMKQNFTFRQQVLKVVSPEGVEKVSELLVPNPLLRISLEEIIESQWMTKYVLNKINPKVIKQEKKAQKYAENIKDEMEMFRGKSKYSIQYPWIKIEKETYFERLGNLKKRHSSKGKGRNSIDDDLYLHYRNSEIPPTSDTNTSTGRSRDNVSRVADIYPSVSRSKLTTVELSTPVNVHQESVPPVEKASSNTNKVCSLM